MAQDYHWEARRKARVVEKQIYASFGWNFPVFFGKWLTFARIQNFNESKLTFVNFWIQNNKHHMLRSILIVLDDIELF